MPSSEKARVSRATGRAVELRTTPIVLVIAVLVAVSGLAAIIANHAGQLADKAVHHSLNVESDLDDIVDRVQDIQIATRGYLISQSPAELGACHEWLDSLPAAVTHAGEGLSDPEAQRIFKERFDPAIREKIAFRREFVETVRREGFHAGVDLMQTGRGQKGMDEIRNLKDELNALQFRGFEHLQRRAAFLRTAVSWLTGISTTSALVLLGLTLLSVRTRLRDAQEVEATLVRSHEALTEAQRIARVGNWSWDPIASEMLWSDQIYKIFGLEPDEKAPDFIGIQRYLTAVSTRVLDAAITQASAFGTAFDVELEALRAGKDRMVLRIRGEALRDESGALTKLVGTMQDTTHERQTSENLQLANERMRLATAAGGFAIWDLHLPEGRLVWDAEMHRLYGTSPQYFSGSIHEWMRRVHPDDAARVEEMLNAGVDGAGDHLALEFRITPDNAPVRIVEARATILRDKNQRAIRILGSNRDVTKERTLSAELEQNRRELLEAQHLAKVGSWSFDPESSRVVWSNELFNIFGLSPYGEAPQLGDHPELFPPEATQCSREAIARCIETREPYTIEFEAIRTNGERVRIQSCGRAECDETGRVTRLVGTAQDITEARRVLEQERELARRALAGEQAKARFLATMSHEIRTPLNGVLGFADLLASQPLNDDQRGYVRTIRESGHALLRIIDDVLEFSRMNSTAVEIETAPWNPRAVGSSVIELMSEAARRKGIALQFSMDPAIPETLLGDSGRVRQILINLVNNALKFTDSGSIHVEFFRTENDSTPTLEIRVRDTGRGIAPDKLDSIFEPFTQEDSSQSRQFGGAGLGLAIVRTLSALMKGSVRAESEPGNGSCFICTLPLVESVEPVKEVQATPEVSETFATQYPLNILVAEDDPVNLRLAKLVLSRLGYHCHVASGGTEAVDRWKEVRPDVVLMDLHMPGLDGLDATREIRALEKESGANRRTFIAAFTADVMTSEREECRSAGMDDYFTKPLRMDRLAEVLRAASASRTAA